MARCAGRALGSGHGFKCLYILESSQQPTGWELWLSHFAHEGAGAQGGDSLAPGHAALWHSWITPPCPLPHPSLHFGGLLFVKPYSFFLSQFKGSVLQEAFSLDPSLLPP